VAVATTHVGAATFVVVTTHDEQGGPVADYTGTVTISPGSGTSATFPDGASVALDATTGVTGHEFRVLFGETGEGTVVVDGPGLVSDSVTVEVAETVLDLTVTAIS
jgi:hypothetical protein